MTLRRIAFGLLLLPALTAPALGQTASIGYSWQGATNDTMRPLNGGFFGFPPDTNGSVGINQYVQSVNGGFLFFNKDGTTAASSQGNHTFWTSRVGLSTGSSVGNYTDPRVYYDPLSQRWFAVEITSASTNNRILLGRSDTSDPTGTWHGLTINSTSGQFADFPTLAVDANAVYLGTNNFNGPGSQTSMITVSKSDFLANPTATTPTVFNTPSGNFAGFTLQGINDLTGATAGATTGLFLGTGVTLGTGEDVISRTIVNNPAGPGATFTLPTGSNGGFITTSPTSVPGFNAPQLGTGVTLDNGDDRIGSNVYRVGNLVYLTRTVGAADGRAAVRWTVLSVDPATNAMAVVREGTVDIAGTHAFTPSIVANTKGDFVITFAQSSQNMFPAMMAVVGSTSDFSNWSVGSPMTLQAGQTFQDTGGSVGRWGDYTSVSLDPADPGSFWATGEYMPNVAGAIGANRNWGTRVVEVIPTKAGEVRWQATGAGSPFDFSSGSNWFNGAAPGATDHVIFSRWSSGSFTVNMPAGTTSNDRLSIRQTGTGTQTFNIPTGATWDLTNTSASAPSLTVSEFQGTSNVVFSGGGTLQTRHALIGGTSGATANVTVSGTGTTWNNLNDLTLGGFDAASVGTGTLTVTGGATAAVGGTLTIRNPGGAAPSGVTVNTGSGLTVGGLTSPTGPAPTVTLNGTGNLTVNGGAGTTFSGVVAGTGTLTKTGSGTFTLTGANTYSGTTTVSGGTLRVSGTGSLANSQTVAVNSGANLNISGVTGGANFNSGRFALAGGQTLQGTGTVTGTVEARGNSTIAPGDGVTGVGNLTVSGDALFTSGTAGSHFRVNLNGAADGQYSRLTVTGALTLAGATLDALLGGGYNPAATDKLFIINNQGPNAVTGTFNNLGEGASFPLGSTTAFISYQGDFVSGNPFGGNDVVLTFTPVPEPTTVLAVAAAGLGLGFAARRRRRAVPA